MGSTPHLLFDLRRCHCCHPSAEETVHQALERAHGRLKPGRQQDVASILRKIASEFEEASSATSPQSPLMASPARSPGVSFPVMRAPSADEGGPSGPSTFDASRKQSFRGAYKKELVKPMEFCMADPQVTLVWLLGTGPSQVPFF